MEDSSFKRRRFLLSLPCNLLYSSVKFSPARGAPLTVEPGHKEKVLRVAQVTLRYLEDRDIGGVLEVESNIEEGKGCGSSTADCVAAVHGVAEALGKPLAEEEVAALVVEAELASDNFMFNHPVLFAHREGVVLEELGPRLPRMEVLGIDTDIDGAVYTLDFPPATYTWRQVQNFHLLVSALRRAVRHRDLGLLGRVATASAMINQQFLPKPMFAEILRISEMAGVPGISVAHSGTVMGILLNPDEPTLEAKVHSICQELERLGIKRILRFQT